MQEEGTTMLVVQCKLYSPEGLNMVSLCRGEKKKDKRKELLCQALLSEHLCHYKEEVLIA